jgi:spore germination protein KB
MKINAFQLFVLIVLFELGSAIVVGLGMQAKQDAWLAILIGMAGGLVVLSASLMNANNFPQHLEIGLKIVPYYLHLPLQTFIPLLLFVIVWTRKRFHL